MSKYVINDTTLIGIGDAIRTKKGTSAQIPVPDLASEILSIPTGGGMPPWVVSGEFTPTEDIESYTVTNNKGVLPIVALLYAEDRYNPTRYMHIMSVGSIKSDESITGALQNASGQTPPNVGAISVAYNGISEFDNTKVTFVTRSGYPFKTGYKYKYFIFFEEA